MLPFSSEFLGVRNNNRQVTYLYCSTLFQKLNITRQIIRNNIQNSFMYNMNLDNTSVPSLLLSTCIVILFVENCPQAEFFVYLRFNHNITNTNEVLLPNITIFKRLINLYKCQVYGDLFDSFDTLLLRIT